MAKGTASKVKPAKDPAAPKTPKPKQTPEDLKGQMPVGKLALVKDPRIYARTLPTVFAPYKRIIGLDLASNCGVSFCDVFPGQPITNAAIIGAQWNLGIGPFDTHAIRYVRLKAFLRVITPDLIVYEEVKFTGQRPLPGTPQQSLSALVARAVSGAQVVQAMTAVLLTWAEENNVPTQSVPISTLKRYATGKGNASKEEMIAACNEQLHTVFDPKDKDSGVDNIADSMFLCKLGVESYAEGLK